MIKRKSKGYDIYKLLQEHWKWQKNIREGKRLDLSGMDLEGIDLEEINLDHASFNYGILDNANFDYTNLTGNVFTKASLTGASFKCASVSHANFANANLTGASFDNSTFSYTSFRDSSLIGASFKNARFIHVSFANANLKYAIFDNCTFYAKDWTVLQLLEADWGKLPPELTLEMMRWDAILGPPELKDRFEKWKKEEVCPFNFNTPCKRSLSFHEDKNVYKPGPPTLSLWELLIELFQVKGIKSDWTLPPPPKKRGGE